MSAPLLVLMVAFGLVWCGWLLFILGTMVYEAVLEMSTRRRDREVRALERAVQEIELAEALEAARSRRRAG